MLEAKSIHCFSCYFVEMRDGNANNQMLIGMVLESSGKACSPSTTLNLSRNHL